MSDFNEYSGPFPGLPQSTRDALTAEGETVIGWRFIIEPDGDNRWKPKGYLVITTGGLVEFDMQRMGTRSAVLYA